MATTVGVLSVDLDLNSAAFINNLKRSTDAVEKSAKSMSSALNIGKLAVGGFLTAFSVDAFSRVTKDALNFAASLGEQAQQLGVTTRELQVYRYAASQAGIANDEMDKGLAKLTLRIGQAAQGNREIGGIFTRLGIAVTDASGRTRSAGAVFEDLADRLSKVADPAKRAEIEVALFGKTGQRLDTLLSGGRKTIENYASAAEKLGIVISQSLIEKADKAADTLDQMSTLIETRLSIVVAENAQGFIVLAEAIGAAVGAVGSFFTAFRGLERISRDEGFLSGFFSSQSRLTAAADPVKYLGQRIAELKTARAELAALERAGPNPNRPDFSNRLADARRREAEAERRLRAARNDPGFLAQLAAERKAASAASAPAVAGSIPAVGSVPGRGRAAGGSARSASSGPTLSERFGVLQDRLDPDQAAVRQYEESIRLINEAEAAGLRAAGSFDALRAAAREDLFDDLKLEQVTVDLEKTGDLTEGFADNLDGLTREAERTGAVLSNTFGSPLQDQIAGITQQLQGDLASGLANTLVYGGDIGDVVVGSFKRLAAAILETIIQAQILGPLLQNIGGGGFGGAGGGGFGGGGIGSVFSIFGIPFGGGRASGGAVRRGSYYLVGEQGPELFAPGQGGTIIPSESLRGGSSRPAPVINLNFDGQPTAETVAAIDRRLQLAAPAIASAAEQRTIRTLNRKRL